MEFYFHPRDKYGSLEYPDLPLTQDFGTRFDPPKTMEEELNHLEMAHSLTKGLGNYQECVDAIKEKWASGSRQKQRDEWEQKQNAKRTSNKRKHK